ncbi:hypothetical protein ACFP3I_10155 [Chryseobacterium arachidis]
MENFCGMFFDGKYVSEVGSLYTLRLFFILNVLPVPDSQLPAY